MFIGEHEKGNITVYSNQVYDNAGRIAVITDSQTPTIDNIVYCSLSIPPRINTNKLIT
jgi:hypothetical protein